MSSTEETIWSRKNPFPARLVENRLLSGPGSEKETRHLGVSLQGSGLQYEAGDSLGVAPSNCGELVEAVLKAAAATGEEPVELEPGRAVTLREAFHTLKDIRKPSGDFLKAVAERNKSHPIAELLVPDRKAELDKYLGEREVVDLLEENPGRFNGLELFRLLAKLQPRLYSISSSPKLFPDETHLTVAAVRYVTLQRQRKGICSTFLADRVEIEGLLPVFIHHSHFKLPTNGDADVIMVGPGTGVAPFRAFLQDRAVSGARGRNWLFFGDQRRASDYLYRDEMEDFLKRGVLERLDLAFSRDQPEKIYVQHRMKENAAALWRWLEAGAYFYVCGDARRMAKDVEATLQQIVVEQGGKSEAQALEFLQKMKQEKRYQRDVY